jgi:O-antigen/teichoic acid export membrane protein
MTFDDELVEGLTAEDVSRQEARRDGETPRELEQGPRGRILRGLTVNVAGNGLTVLIQLVTVPLLLTAWGVDTYGEWLVLSAIPLYVALSDLSLSSAAGNTMTMLESRGQRDETIRLGREVWSLVLIASIAAVLGAIALGSFLVGLGADGSSIPVDEARLVLVALFAQTIVVNQFGVLDAWYRAGLRYPLGVTLRQVGRLVEFGSLATAVIVGAQPGGAAVAVLVGSTAGFVVSLLVLRRAVPWTRVGPARPRASTFRGLLKPGLAFLAFPLSNTLSVQGLVIVVGSVLGSAAVVVFATTRTLTRVVTQLLSSINLAIWPELSRSIGGGDLGQARQIQRRSVQLALLVSGFAAIVLLLFGPTIIETWTRGMVDPPLDLLAVLVLVVVVNSFWFTLTTPLVATNRHSRMAVVYLVSTAVAVVLAVPLASRFGVVGAAGALLAIDVGMTFYVLPAALRLVQDTPNAFVRGVIDLRGALRTVRAIATSR